MRDDEVGGVEFSSSKGVDFKNQLIYLHRYYGFNEYRESQ